MMILCEKNMQLKEGPALKCTYIRPPSTSELHCAVTASLHTNKLSYSLVAAFILPAPYSYTCSTKCCQPVLIWITFAIAPPLSSSYIASVLSRVRISEHALPCRVDNTVNITRRLRAHTVVKADKGQWWTQAKRLSVMSQVCSWWNPTPAAGRSCAGVNTGPLASVQVKAHSRAQAPGGTAAPGLGSAGDRCGRGSRALQSN